MKYSQLISQPDEVSKMARSSFAFLVLVTCAALPGAAQPARAEAGLAASPASFEMLPGVVVERSRPALFLMSPERGVDAVDPRTGDLLWSSSEAARPVLAAGDRVYAQAEPSGGGVLEVVALSALDGRRQAASTIALPAGVNAGIGDGLESSFRVWAALEGGDLRLGWENTTRRSSPLPPKEGESVAAPRTGAAGIRASALGAEEFSVLGSVPARPDAPVARASWDDAHTSAAHLGALQATVVTSGQGRLVLRRGDASGAALPEVVLSEGGYHLRMPSVDGRHLLVSREVDPGSGEGYRLEIFDLATGSRLGEMPSRRSHVAFFVVGDVVVFETAAGAARVDDRMIAVPRQLNGFDLAAESLVWQRPLRDTRFRGQRPR
jgi:hypothetical protein